MKVTSILPRYKKEEALLIITARIYGIQEEK
jgi:hypothetical protein